MSIEDALRPTGLPVSGLPYEGRADTYVTYQLIGQLSTIYAEGREAATAVLRPPARWRPI